MSRRSGPLVRTGPAALLASLLLLVQPLAAQTAPAHTCLWRVTGGQNTVYLLGSIHMLPPDAWPLPEPMRHAFDRAATVVFEADLGNAVEAGLLMLQRAALPAGTTLATVLPANLHTRLTAAVRRLGGDPGGLERVKPWFAAITLTSLELEAAGYHASEGIDLRLWSRATSAGKKTEGLETLAHQIDILDSFTMAEQIELLRQSLDELDTVVPELDRLTELWRTGRAEALASMLRGTFKDAPGAYRKLVLERNRAWLPKILAMTRRPGDVLVVVGVLHLVGPEGLVQSLRSHGLTVVQE